MVRWQPGAKERLQGAAMQLYAERGFERTTAADIAAAAGLTERTFFRHFADKREVLFDGQDRLRQSMIDAVAAAPTDASPVEMVAAALDAVSDFFADERREHSRRRQLIIEQNPALQERELLKRARLATALGEALRAHGITDPDAALAAESGVAIFHVAFGQWIAPGEERGYRELQRAGLRALGVLHR
ncbi:TetR family transcriptional regulator [Microbacteriaceae bacterium VKM Ac-2855]|nr:TetR family transcriptional regulator [Microbacteriaceae bacterium VKM Ac-2855]